MAGDFERAANMSGVQPSMSLISRSVNISANWRTIYKHTHTHTMINKVSEWKRREREKERERERERGKGEREREREREGERDDLLQYYYHHNKLCGVEAHS